jgi:hypothetical protein
MATIRTSLQDEVKDVIYRHLDELGEYIPQARITSSVQCERVIACVERLAEICAQRADSATIDLYGEACSCRHRLEAFLRSMNQCLDGNFERTSIGQVWVESQVWCQQASTRYRLNVNEIWEIIAPVAPDHLNDLGNGQYEARWWKPAPAMDIEILKLTDGVVITGEPFEPPNLAGGLALRFSISRFG